MQCSPYYNKYFIFVANWIRVKCDFEIKGKQMCIFCLIVGF